LPEPKRSPSRTDILRFVAVDAEAPLPLATQLRQQLAWLIASGQVKAGERLPPVRQVAEHLGIDRNTVRAAYTRLEADGLLTLRQGRGSVVRPYDVQRSRRQLASLPSFTIGVLVPGLNPFYTPFLRGIEETARNVPYLPLVCYTHDDLDLARSYLDQLLAKSVDGLIVLPDLPETEGDPVDLPPVVHVDKPCLGHGILLDSEQAGYLATRHLIEHGHKRIGLITGLLEWPNVRECYAGYERALRSVGLAVDAECVAEVTEFSIEAGHQATQRLLELPNPPAAIFGAADVLAIGSMIAIKERGRRVPEDIAVVGYNNIDLAALVEPPLTTVAAPSYDMGVAAMTMLLQLMAGKPVKQRRVKLPTKLIVRRSCGCEASPQRSGGGCKASP